MQVVGHLPDGDLLGWQATELGDQWPEVFVGEAAGLEPEQR